MTILCSPPGPLSVYGNVIIATTIYCHLTTSLFGGIIYSSVCHGEIHLMFLVRNARPRTEHPVEPVLPVRKIFFRLLQFRQKHHLWLMIKQHEILPFRRFYVIKLLIAQCSSWGQILGRNPDKSKVLRVFLLAIYSQYLYSFALRFLFL